MNLYENELEIDDRVGWHGRTGIIFWKDCGNYLVYFEDTNEKLWLNRSELVK
jgi:hypothetical protein